MKKCKVLKVNYDDWTELESCSEECGVWEAPSVQSEIEEYLNKGYEVKGFYCADTIECTVVVYMELNEPQERKKDMSKDISDLLVGVLASDVDEKKSHEERMEDLHDLDAYDRAMAEYKKNPVTYTMEEIEKMLDEENPNAEH